jgi:hypothetical protein
MVSKRDFYWYSKSVREELKERILNQLPKSMKKTPYAEGFASDFVYDEKRLKLQDVFPQKSELLKEGRDYVMFNIKMGGVPAGRKFSDPRYAPKASKPFNYNF